jgi:hypothetical protein
VLNSGGDLIFCRAIFRDPSIYPEPDVFKPERFLNPDGSLRDDPILSSAFGYGKRICPGRHFVDATLFIYAASLLSVFHIEQDGQEKQREYKYSEAIVRWISFLASLSIQRNRKADSFLAVRNHSRAPSLPGIKRQKSLLLQMLWRNDFLG